MRVGASVRRRATVAATPSGSFVAVHRTPSGPARHDQLRFRHVHTHEGVAHRHLLAVVRPGPALRYRVAPCATVRAHDETPATPRLSCGLIDRRKYRAVADRTSSLSEKYVQREDTRKYEGRSGLTERPFSAPRQRLPPHDSFEIWRA